MTLRLWAAAMDQLTRNLACEWGPRDGIRVNCVKPWCAWCEFSQGQHV